MIPEPPPPATGSARRLVRESVAGVIGPVADRLRRASGLAPIEWELLVGGATPEQALAWIEAALVRPRLLLGINEGVSYRPGSREFSVIARRPLTDYARFDAAAVPGGAVVRVSQRVGPGSILLNICYPLAAVGFAASAIAMRTWFVVLFAAALMAVVRTDLRISRLRSRTALRRVLKQALDRRGGGVV